MVKMPSSARMTLKQELDFKRQTVAAQLKEIDSAIDLLEQHPEVEQVLNALKKVGRY
jgi:chaperonin cofactor prefoldin